MQTMSGLLSKNQSTAIAILSRGDSRLFATMQENPILLSGLLPILANDHSDGKRNFMVSYLNAEL